MVDYLAIRPTGRFTAALLTSDRSLLARSTMTVSGSQLRLVQRLCNDRLVAAVVDQREGIDLQLLAAVPHAAFDCRVSCLSAEPSTSTRPHNAYQPGPRRDSQ
jgi:hypothetical protein